MYLEKTKDVLQIIACYGTNNFYHEHVTLLSLCQIVRCMILLFNMGVGHMLGGYLTRVRDSQRFYRVEIIRGAAATFFLACAIIHGPTLFQGLSRLRSTRRIPVPEDCKHPTLMLHHSPFTCSRRSTTSTRRQLLSFLGPGCMPALLVARILWRRVKPCHNMFPFLRIAQIFLYLL
jgi:hypothetical protein